MSRAQFNAVFPDVIRFRQLAVDIASLADGVGATQVITVAGAALGDLVLVAFGVSLAGITVTSYVAAADTVHVRVQNESGGVLDLASTAVTGVVLKVFVP